MQPPHTTTGAHTKIVRIVKVNVGYFPDHQHFTLHCSRQFCKSVVMDYKQPVTDVINECAVFNVNILRLNELFF